MPRGELAQAEVDLLASVISERTSLRVAGAGREKVGRLAMRRMAELGQSFGQYVGGVRLGTLESGELALAVAEITVGESYFFRDGPLLDAMRTRVLPLLMERRRATRTLRVLSAGCATGEEPYTLAIALGGALPPGEQWTLEVVGLDINGESLRRAAAGVYGEWSLRDVPTELRQRYFHPDEGGYRLRPELAACVRFDQVNLATNPFPAAALGVLGMDLIMCRNVLYHLGPEARGVVVENLTQALLPGGFLVFGAADWSREPIRLCRTRVFDGIVLSERMSDEADASLPPPAPGPCTPGSTRIRPATEALRGLTAGLVKWDIAPSLDVVLQLADRGDLSEAARVLGQLLERDPANAPAHLVHGLLSTELGAYEAALAAFRRSLYLDPKLLLAHAGAAIVARRLGLTRLARRHASCARSLAKDLGPTSPMEGWKGMTAARAVQLLAELTHTSEP